MKEIKINKSESTRISNEGILVKKKMENYINKQNHMDMELKTLKKKVENLQLKNMDKKDTYSTKSMNYICW